MTLADELPAAAIAVRAEAGDWRAAVTLAGERLTAHGVATADYTAEMIAAIEEHGPYVVIAPGFALAHSRPSPAVHRAGLSFVSLREPVAFGNAANDPVDIVMGLAAVDHDGHIELMSALAAVLADDATMQRLREATSVGEVRVALGAESSEHAQPSTSEGNEP